MSIKALVYDFDGVICNSVNIKTEAFFALYSPYGEDIQKKVVEYHLEHGGISRFEKIKFWHRNYLNQEIDDSTVEKLASEFASLVLKKVIQSDYIKGSLEFLKLNSGRFLQFICTGTPQNEILQITQARDITKYFNGIYGTPSAKDAILRNILRKYNLRPEEILFFGDALTDYNAAMKIGTLFCGIQSSDTKFPPGTHTALNFELLNLLTQ